MLERRSEDICYFQVMYHKCRLERSERSFGRGFRQELWRTKGLARLNETWQWNGDVSNNVREKCKPLKDWKQGNTTNKKYLEAKKKAERAVCQTKYKHELKDFITLCRGMIRNVMSLRYQRRW